MKTRKRIHILGGGYNQLPLLLCAKKMGFWVLCTDVNLNPPCRKFADAYERACITDLQGSLENAIKHKIDFAATDQTDVAVPTVAFIAKKLSLPGIDFDTSLRFTNKYIMRNFLKGKIDENLAENYFFNQENSAIDFYTSLTSSNKYVIKPINSQGSKGVSILGPKFREQMSNAFKESFNRGIIIERFVSGFEFSVESFVHSGKVHNLTLTKKYHYSTNPCLDERNTYLGDVSSDLEEKIFHLNSKIINLLGLKMGNTHAEYKVENGIPFLIEIAARGAGGSISSKIIPYLTGFDPLTAMLNQLRNSNISIDYKDYKSKFAILKFFNFKPGKVKSIRTNEKVISKLLEYNLTLKPGDHIVAPLDSRDRKGYFIVNSENRDAVLNLEKEVESSIRLNYY